MLHPAAAHAAPTIERYTLGPFATNCYVVRGAKDPTACFVVDASFDPGPMIGALRDPGAKVEAIVLTHAHVDHIAGLEELRAAFPDTPVMIHEAEADFLTDPALNLSVGLGAPIVCGPADRLLKGGETLELAGCAWRVLHTPGHSPGGVTLVHDSAGVAIVGDTLFKDSVGRFDFPTSDQRALERSIREELYSLPDAMRVLPGHGPETTIGRERAGNPFVRG